MFMCSRNKKKKNSSIMNHCVVDEKTPQLPTSDTASVKCLKSGKWAAKIRYPISRVWVLLGIYSTHEEAQDACTRKKLEYKSGCVQESAVCINTKITDYEKHQGVRLRKSGKWASAICYKGDHVWLGTYNTLKEATDSYNLSKLELDSRKVVDLRNLGDSIVCPSREDDLSQQGKTPRNISGDAEQSDGPQQRRSHCYKRKSGRWQGEIRNPITKARVCLGTFETAEKCEEAYKKKRREFDLMVCDLKKHTQLNDTIVECKSDSVHESDEPFVNADGSSVVDMDIVDSYGRLVGEYSRLDDELWLR